MAVLLIAISLGFLALTIYIVRSNTQFGKATSQLDSELRLFGWLLAVVCLGASTAAAYGAYLLLAYLNN